MAWVCFLLYRVTAVCINSSTTFVSEPYNLLICNVYTLSTPFHSPPFSSARFSGDGVVLAL